MYGTAALISGAGNLLGGAAGLIGTGKKAQGKYQDMANIAAGDISAFYNKAQSGAYDYKLPTEAADAYQMSKAKTSLDPLKRMEATALSSFASSDPRALLTGVTSTLQRTAEAEMAAQERQLQREIAGTQAFGQQKADIAQANMDFQRGLGMRQLGQAEQAQATALENIESLKAQRRDAFAQMLGGAGSAVAGYGLDKGWFGSSGGQVPKSFFSGGYVAKRPESRSSEIISNQFEDLANLISKKENDDSDDDKQFGGELKFNMGGVNSAGASLGMRVPKKFFLGGVNSAVNSAGAALGSRVIDSLAYTEKGMERRMKKAEQEAKIRAAGGIGDGSGEGGSDITITVNKGGQTQTMKNGGAMMYQMGGDVLSQIMGRQGGVPPVQGPLPGPASHDQNPIHMINNKGEKVGEAMGGEFVINDKQADLLMDAFKGVQKAIEKEERKPTMAELMALYEANKQVFGQPQFNGDDEEMMS